MEEKTWKFCDERNHSAAIQRKYILLELLITADHLLNHNGAHLVSPKGRAINVHPDTIKLYQELQSLICDYIKIYGTNPTVEELGNRWTTPAESTYFN